MSTYLEIVNKAAKFHKVDMYVQQDEDDFLIDTIEVTEDNSISAYAKGDVKNSTQKL